LNFIENEESFHFFEDPLEYINDILNDKTFQNNPRAYLNE